MLAINNGAEKQLEHADSYGSKKNIQETDIIVKTPDLYYSKRSKETLIVEPASGSWIVVDERRFKAIMSISSPMLFKSVREKNTDFSPDELDRFFDILYANNIISVNTQRFFNENNFGKCCYQWPALFVIFVTDKCNLKCKYCYFSAHEHGKKMPKKVLDTVIHRMYAELPNNSPHYTIAFHGGEPTLAMDNIVEIYNQTAVLDKKYNKKTSFICQTNGTQLNEKMAALFKEMNVGVGISLDGPKEIHDKYRQYPGGRGSFDDVMEGLRVAKKAGLKSGLLATIYEPEDYYKTFSFFMENGYTSFRMALSQCFSGRASMLDYPEDRNYRFAESFLKTVDLAAEYNRSRPGELGYSNLDEMLCNIVHKTRTFMCLRSPCGAGNSILCFTAQGDIYPCDSIAGEKDLKIGTVYDPRPLHEILSRSPVVQKLRRRTFWNVPKCGKCTWRNFCGIDCAGRSYGTFKDLYRESSYCAFSRIIYEKLIWKLHDEPDMVELLPKRLLNTGGVPC